MIFLKSLFEVFNREEIDSTNNAIEFIWETQCTVRTVDKYVFFFLFSIQLIFYFVHVFLHSACPVFMDNISSFQTIW